MVHDSMNTSLIRVRRSALALFVLSILTGMSAAQDARVLAILSPSSVQPGGVCSGLSANETVSLRAFNGSLQVIPTGTVVGFSYSFDNGVNPPQTVMETMTLAAPWGAFQLQVYTFTTALDLSAGGTFSFVLDVDVPGDTQPANDALSGSIFASTPGAVGSFPWLETFDGAIWTGQGNGTTALPIGWTNVQGEAAGENSDWFLRNVATPTTVTGPPGDRTTGQSGQGYFAYVEDSGGGNHSNVELLTPCLNLASLSDPRLAFWAYSWDFRSGLSENFLAVDAIDAGGNETLDLLQLGRFDRGWRRFVIDLTPFAGQIVRLRFRVDSSNGGEPTHFYTHDVCIDDVSVFDASGPDLGVQALLSPVQAHPESCAAYGANHDVTVRFLNEGGLLAAGTSVQVAYALGAQVQSEMVVLANDLDPGEIFDHTFAQPLDISAPDSSFSIATSVALVGDVNSANDAAQELITSDAVISSFPWTENFDAIVIGGGGGGGSTATPPPGWRQEVTDHDFFPGGGGGGAAINWLFRNQPTPTGGVGPPADHTTGVPGQGVFAYVEDSNNGQTATNLRTPCFDTNGLGAPQMTFWVHSDDSAGGASASTLHIDLISHPGEVLTPDFIPAIGHLGTGWTEFVIALPVDARFELRFRVNDGDSNTHDIAIDDLAIANLEPAIGQAPQFGRAVMDINEARERNGFSVSSGINGPYFTDIVSGDDIDFTISGVPDQKIILLSGPLTPGASVFAGIGQLDIGTYSFPLPPQNIVVVSDGFSGTGFFPSFFDTGSTGTMALSVSLNAPPGATFPFQALVLTGDSAVIALTNAVSVSVL